MDFVLIPGFGIFPRALVRPMSETRLVGQADPRLVNAQDLRDISAEVATRQKRAPQQSAFETLIEIVDERKTKRMRPNETIEINTDMTTRQIRELIGFDKIEARFGTYVRCPRAGASNEWWFVLDPRLRVVALALTGTALPEKIPVDRLICWKLIPSLPLVGGFTHPIYGFHCRSADIPLWWDEVIHGNPRMTLRGGLSAGLSLSAEGDLSGMDPAASKAAEVAEKFNKFIGLGKKPPLWWLYTLPSVEKGKPVISVGVAGDVATYEQVKALIPAALARNVTFSIDVVQPKSDDMGSAPVVSVPMADADATGADLDFGDFGMGYAPLVAMPTGMLNWDRVSGYEGQNWTIPEHPAWTAGLGLGDASGGPAAESSVPRPLAVSLTSAAVGAAAGYFMAPSGADPKRSAAFGAVGFGAAGWLVGKLLSAAEQAIRGTKVSS